MPLYLQDMSIHDQRIVLRILEACQAELKGVKLKDYAGTKRKFEHGPVSYTHLDVYKRQSIDFGMLMHKGMYLTLFLPDVITMKS